MKAGKCEMDAVFQRGRLNYLDELEKLYHNLNDYLAETINYPGWRKDIYPVRQTALDGLQENSLYIVRKRDEIIGSAIIRNRPEKACSYSTSSIF